MRDYNFGNFIFELRTEKGLSQSQLGEMLGVTNKAVSKWENGTAKPNTSLYPKISEILGVSVEEIFAGKRLDKNDDTLRLHTFLQSLKIRYARLTSLFFALIIILPFLITEYTAASQILQWENEDVLAAGAAILLSCLIISIVCLIIYKSNFKHIPIQYDIGNNMKKASIIVKGFTVTLVILLTEIIASPIVCSLVAEASPNTHVFWVITLSLILAFILTLGIWCYFARLKGLLKISYGSVSKGHKLSFSKLPVFIKIALCLEALLVPIKLNLDFFQRENSPIKFAVSILFWAILIIINIYNLSNSKKNK